MEEVKAVAEAADYKLLNSLVNTMIMINIDHVAMYLPLRMHGDIWKVSIQNMPLESFARNFYVTAKLFGREI